MSRYCNPQGGGPRVVVSTAAFHARVRGSVPGPHGLKEKINVSSPSTCESQYCGEPPWPRGSELALRLISSITSLSTLMTFCKVNGTSMSPANCSRYNQSLSNLLHQWNAEEMTLSYAGPELAMPISQTAIYWEWNCDLCAAILVSL